MVQDNQPTFQVEQPEGDSFETRQMGETVSPSLTTQPVDSYVAQPSVSQPTQIIGESLSTLAWLVALNGIRQGRLFPVDARGTTIGRDAQNDIVLDDTTVSRQHAKIRREEGSHKAEQFFLYDLGSANGTFLNERKAVRQALSDDDRIRIGEITLVFKMVDDTPPSAAKTQRAKRKGSAKRKK